MAQDDRSGGKPQPKKSDDKVRDLPPSGGKDSEKVKGGAAKKSAFNTSD